MLSAMRWRWELLAGSCTTTAPMSELQVQAVSSSCCRGRFESFPELVGPASGVARVGQNLTKAFLQLSAGPWALGLLG